MLDTLVASAYPHGVTVALRRCRPCVRAMRIAHRDIFHFDITSSPRVVVPHSLFAAGRWALDTGDS